MPKTLLTDNTELTREKQMTFINEDVVATGSTIRVQSLIGFQSLSTSSGQIVCIGEIGDEKTEILRTSDSTALSTTYKQIALNSNMLFDHSQDTPVYIINWDRIEARHATTATGTKSTIKAYPVFITPDQSETLIRDTTQTTGFYFTRFNESIGNTNSDFTDPIPYGGFGDNSVFSIKERALEGIGEEVDGKLVTNEFLNQTLWEARREYHESPGKRPFRRNFNANIGSAITGSYRIDLPTNVERPYTEENIFGVRIGTNANMTFQGKKEWDFDYRNIAHSQLDLAYTADVSTSIWLANGRDFADSAVITVEGTNIGLSRVLGETGSFYVYEHGAYSASAGSDAFTNATPGLPDRFTVWAEPGGGSAYIYFNRPIATAYVNQNIWCDYYRTLVGFDSDGDVLDEPDYDMYVDYLKAQIKHRKNKGESNLIDDPNYKVFQFKKSVALAKEYDGTEIRIFPDVEHLPLAGENRSSRTWQ